MTTYTLEYALAPHAFVPDEGPVCGRCSLLPEGHDERLAELAADARAAGVMD